MAKRITPLMVILILGIVIGGVGAAWYWTSQEITTTVTVSGWMNVKASVDPRDVWFGGAKVDFADLTEISALLDGEDIGLDSNKFYVFAIVGGTNAETIYTRTIATKPPGMTATCNVALYSRFEDGTWAPSGPIDLGSIALDGSQPVQCIGDTLPLWLLNGGSGVRMLGFEFDIGKGSLGIGSYDFSVNINLGDNL